MNVEWQCSGVYLIVCRGDMTKVYVGSSKNVRNRLMLHRKKLRNGSHGNSHLLRAFQRYGENAFEFRLVERTSPETRLIREQVWIDGLDATNVQIGFNINPKSDSPLGKKLSPEKLEQHNNRVRTLEIRTRVSNSLQEYFSHQENRDLVSEICNQPEVRAKRAASQRRRYADPAQRKVLSENAKRQWSDPEARRRHSEKLRAIMNDPEFRQKRIQAIIRRNCETSRKAVEMSRE